MSTDKSNSCPRDEVDGGGGGIRAEGFAQDIIFDSENVERNPWTICGQKCSRSFLLFFYQCLLVLILTIMSVIRITLSTTCEEVTIWVAILTSSIGYMLPSPRPS